MTACLCYCTLLAGFVRVFPLPRHGNIRKAIAAVRGDQPGFDMNRSFAVRLLRGQVEFEEGAARSIRIAFQGSEYMTIDEVK